MTAAKRSTKPNITLAKVREIGRLVGMGVPVREACLAKGVAEKTLLKHVKADAKLGEAWEKAKATFMCDAVEKIAAGTTGWQGMAWILERRHWQLFSRRTAEIEIRNQVTVQNGGCLSEKDLEHLAKLAQEHYENLGVFGRN